MTYQIDLMLRNISEDNNFEDDEIIIRTYIEQLEQRIAELEEPKTCEGCKWDCPRESFIYDEYCSMCIRDNNKEDYYEPKEI